MVTTGLQPLEFKDCQLDSPDFRDNLNKHEKVLDKTSQQIKRIIKEVKDLLTAAKNLSRAQRTLSMSLDEFNFECIGSTQTDDEQVIVDSLKQFSKMIANIEDERDNMLARAHDMIVVPLEKFRTTRIGNVKDNKKKFDKKTAKFCKAQELFLSMSSKKPDNTIQEADASLGMLEREYLRESLSYVLAIQDVQERIKFEFVETLLSFMSGWMVFYHWGHDTAIEAREYMTDLQHKVQKTRENFDETQAKAEELKSKYMDSKMKPDTEFTKQGYLFLMEKSKLKAFTATWTKYYCTYKKQHKQFTMQAYNQMSVRSELDRESLTLAQCTRRASEFEKRYCFDLTFEQKPNITLTFQALCEEDRKMWLNAMDGKEPTVFVPGALKSNEEYALDEVGFAFARKCIEVLEVRGLEEEGLYRIGGVNTKITKLIGLGMDRSRAEKERLSIFYDEQYQDLTETKTIASALKHYLRNLNEPLMTFRFHNGFIAAAKQDTRMQRISDVHTLVHRLPQENFEMLDIVIRHLKLVSQKCSRNKMSVFNLGVVFGPTLLRAVEETLAAILDIKFNNVVIEILIENYDVLFKSPPGPSVDYGQSALSHGSAAPEPGPRSYSGYHPRMSSGSTSSSYGGAPGSGGGGRPRGEQPVVRVTTRSQYTDPIMSSSLQNIPNGVQQQSTIYQLAAAQSHSQSQSQSPSSGTHSHTSPHRSPKSLQHQMQHFQPHSSLYDKAAGQKGPPAAGNASQLLHQTRDLSHSARNLSMGGGGGGAGGSGVASSYLSSLQHQQQQQQQQQHHQHQPHHQQQQLSPNNHHRAATEQYHVKKPSASGGYVPATATLNSLRHQMGSGASATMSRSTGDGIYAQSPRLPPIAYSESNLASVHPGGGGGSQQASAADRMQSTSSSNESVCSATSLTHHSALAMAGQYARSIGGAQQPHSLTAGTGSTGKSGYLAATATSSSSRHLLGNGGGGGGAGGGGAMTLGSGGGSSPYGPSAGGGGGGSGVGNNESSQNILPKKTQRSKETGRQMLNWNRENVRVRTLYACLAENDGELSFEPNQIITNVRTSNEPGWLDGTLNGKSGLIPENYVEMLP